MALSARSPSSAEPANPGSVAAAARVWLADLAARLEAGDADQAAELFRPDASWRDIVALTCDIRSVTGPAAITGMLGRCIKHVDPASIRVSADWPPIQQKRADRPVIEVLFDFDDRRRPGRGRGAP